MSTQVEKFNYDDAVVRKFTFATALWGVVAMLAGLWLALMLVMPELSFGLPQLTFGRLRPLHTNAAIFAFAGNAIFAAIYYSSQRLLKARMFNDALSNFHFWGWQAIRRERHIYVAIWFYMATIITVAILHIVNNLALPVSATKSYSLYAGVQDAFIRAASARRARDHGR
jgi:cytochrome c oxidase cbb3-type subunit I/II